MRQIAYALLVAVGFATTWFFNVQFAREHHAFSVIDFVRGGFASPAAASITCDITIAFLAFLIWLPDEARRSGVRHWWIYALIGLCVAFAVALPLFLLVRERTRGGNGTERTG